MIQDRVFDASQPGAVAARKFFHEVLSLARGERDGFPSTGFFTYLLRSFDVIFYNSPELERLCGEKNAFASGNRIFFSQSLLEEVSRLSRGNSAQTALMVLMILAHEATHIMRQHSLLPPLQNEFFRHYHDDDRVRSAMEMYVNRVMFGLAGDLLMQPADYGQGAAFYGAFNIKDALRRLTGVAFSSEAMALCIRDAMIAVIESNQGVMVSDAALMEVARLRSILSQVDLHRLVGRASENDFDQRILRPIEISAEKNRLLTGMSLSDYQKNLDLSLSETGCYRLICQFMPQRRQDQSSAHSPSKGTSGNAPSGGAATSDAKNASPQGTAPSSAGSAADSSAHGDFPAGSSSNNDGASGRSGIDIVSPDQVCAALGIENEELARMGQDSFAAQLREEVASAAHRAKILMRRIPKEALPPGSMTGQWVERVEVTDATSDFTLDINDVLDGIQSLSVSNRIRIGSYGERMHEFSDLYACGAIDHDMGYVLPPSCHLILLVDSSGSMSGPQIGQCVRLVAEAAQVTNVIDSIVVTQGDTQLLDTQILSLADALSLESIDIHGRGGTDVGAVLEQSIESSKKNLDERGLSSPCAAIVLFTDGQTDLFDLQSLLKKRFSQDLPPVHVIFPDPQSMARSSWLVQACKKTGGRAGVMLADMSQAPDARRQHAPSTSSGLDSLPF